MKLPLLLLLLATGLSKVGLSPTLPPATPERGAGSLASGRVPQAAPLTDSTAEKMLVFQRSITVKFFNLRLTAGVLKRITTLREKRPRKLASPKLGISTHDWILEAIEEKMQREGRKHSI